MDEIPMEAAPVTNAVVEEEIPADILLSDLGRKFLSQTRPWVRFLSVIVFIGAGFMVVGAISMFLFQLTGSLIDSKGELFSEMAGGGYIVGILYLCAAVLYIAPGIYLSRYAAAIKILETAGTSQALETALKHQKSFWRYVGILTVIGLVLMAAAIAFTVAFTFFMLLNRS